MTQAPATPSLVERLRDQSAHEGERVSDIMTRWNAHRVEAADALEASQARIAELEADTSLAYVASLQKALRPFAGIWNALRDPLPQRPFRVSVDAMACCEAAKALSSSQGRHEGGENSFSQSQPCGVGPSDLTDPQSQHSDGGR